MCVWEQITRPRCQTKTVKGPMCHVIVYMSAHTGPDFSGDHYPEVPATDSLWKGHSNARLTFMASSACRKLLLSVASWVCFTSSCQEESRIWVFTGRVSVSYSHQMMNAADSQMYRRTSVTLARSHNSYSSPCRLFANNIERTFR